MEYERLNDALSDIQATPRDSTDFPALLFTRRDVAGKKCAIRDIIITDIPMLMDVDAVREIAAYLTEVLGCKVSAEFGRVNIPVNPEYRGDIGDLLDEFKKVCNGNAANILGLAREYGKTKDTRICSK